MINDYTKEIMSRNYDNWDRLLKATLLRQEFRRFSRLDSLSSPSSSNFSSFSSTGSSRSFLPSDPRISLFSRREIELATNCFNDRNLIKRGQSGDLFLGSHEFPEDIIVKRISSLDRKAPLSFELDFFAKINNCDKYHPRFVQLLGHCLDGGDDKFLVYIYLPKRDLSKALVPDQGGGLRSLDWITRWKIARGVAEALSYLHHECKSPLVHGDVKASSILLDHSFEVRLGSLSKVFRRKDKYTFPWRTSTTSLDRRDTPKKSVCAYDVYCFGKVLLELVTGKLGISSCSDKDAEVVLETTLSYININRMEPIKNIVDPSLVIDEELLEEVWAVAIIARACLNLNTKRRPIIKHVLKALGNPAKLISLINKSPK